MRTGWTIDFIKCIWRTYEKMLNGSTKQKQQNSTGITQSHIWTNRSLRNHWPIVHAIPSIVTWRNAVDIGLKNCEDKSPYPDIAQTSSPFLVHIDRTGNWATFQTCSNLENIHRGRRSKRSRTLIQVFNGPHRKGRSSPPAMALTLQGCPLGPRRVEGRKNKFVSTSNSML